LAHQGLIHRGQRGKSPAPITWQGLAKILANPVYIGVVEWNGIQYPGSHEPLVDPDIFHRLHELLAARAARGTREHKHPHYLKGLLHCGVCGPSIQHSTGRYVFFCLGRKSDRLGTCREPCLAADDLEAQVEDLYRRIQLPESWAEGPREEMAAEIDEHQTADTAQRNLLTSQLGKAEHERRKRFDAYGGAIDVPTLKTERTGSARSSTPTTGSPTSTPSGASSRRSWSWLLQSLPGAVPPAARPTIAPEAVQRRGIRTPGSKGRPALP